MNKKKQVSDVVEFTSHAEDPFLSYTEAGDLVGRSNSTIRRWVEDGLLRKVEDPSGCPRIRKSELTRFYGASALAEMDAEKHAREEVARQEMLERMRQNEQRQREQDAATERRFNEQFNPHLLNSVQAHLVKDNTRNG
jgi:hypothetical protein